MTEPNSDWGRWQDEWQRGDSRQLPVTAGLRQVAKARREFLLIHVVEALIGFASVLLLALALKHVANPFQAALGVAVGAGIGLIWAQRIVHRRQEYASATAASVNYLASLRAVRERQIRLARFVWLVIALDVVFLIPWWVIGSRVHARKITDVGSALPVWLPIAGFIALLVWSLGLRRNARKEIGAIDQVTTGDRDEPGSNRGL